MLFSSGLSLCGALAAMAQTVQPWVIVDDIANGKQTSMSADRAGNVFVAGRVYDGVRTMGSISRGDNQGTTWTTLAIHDDVEIYGAIAAATIQVAPASATTPAVTENHLVAAGYLKATWVTRRSLDAGAKWETIDSFPVNLNNPTAYTMISGVSIDSAGNCYVVGTAQQSNVLKNKNTVVKRWVIRKIVKGAPTAGELGTSTFFLTETASGSWTQPNEVVCVGKDVFVAGRSADRWQVRRNTGGGSQWSLVDDFRADPNYHAEAWGISAGGDGNLYVAGNAVKNVGTVASSFWMVRKGTGIGTGTFETIDTFQPEANLAALARGITADAAGGLHVTGRANYTVGSRWETHWITRRFTPGSFDRPGSWTITDNFAPPNPVDALAAEGRNIAVDPSGNVFTSGRSSQDSDGEHNWVVRRQPAAP